MKITHRLVYGFFLIEILLFLLAMLFLQRVEFSEYLRYPMHALSSGWTVERFNGSEKTDLLNYRVRDLRKGETITLRTTLPDDVMPSPNLMFKTMQCAVTVTLDGEALYAAEHDTYQDGKMLSRRYHSVALPEDAAGREVTILLTAGENNALYSFDPVYYGNAYDLYRLNLIRRRVPLYAGIFMLVFGLIQLVFVPYMRKKDEDDAPRIAFASFVNIMMGLFLLAANLMIQVLTGSAVLNTYVEFISVFCNLAAVSGFLMYALDNRRYRAIFKLLFLLNLVLLVAAAVLHFFNIVHLSQMLLPYYILTILEAIPFLVYTVKGFFSGLRKDTAFSGDLLAERILFLGFSVYFVCCMMYVAGLLYTRFLSQGAVEPDIHVMTFGSVIFCNSMVLNYFLSTISQVSARDERHHLVNLAYSDPMTGLSNRARCAQVMEVLSRGVDPYMVFSLDMDHLKRVNDTLGHVEGDRLIRGFSDILKESFWDAILIGRMGGDEFVIITGDTSDAAAERRMQAMKVIMDDRNRHESNFTYSVSYGYAASTESASGWAHEVYNLADHRMYDMKKRRHEEKEGSA